MILSEIKLGWFFNVLNIVKLFESNSTLTDLTETDFAPSLPQPKRVKGEKSTCSLLALKSDLRCFNDLNRRGSPQQKDTLQFLNNFIL